MKRMKESMEMYREKREIFACNAKQNVKNYKNKTIKGGREIHNTNSPERERERA